MSAKKRGLGRGLDALLGGARVEVVAERMRVVSVGTMAPGSFQPRKDMDPARLRELADSISAQGLVQPVVVREADAGRYEIIAGERRWRAAQLAGLTEVPVIIKKVSDQAALAIALIENIQREDLNALEEAEALRRLLDEYRMTHQQLADAVGKSRAAVSNLLRLNDLCPEVKALVAAGQIEMGHARALLALSGAAQIEMAARVVEGGLTVRAVEALVQARSKDGAKQQQAAKSKPDPDIRKLEDDISGRIGARVSIRHGTKGSGQLVIKYSTLDELDGVLSYFRPGVEH
jgi:ParB family chromosome partitioning protein